MSREWNADVYHRVSAPQVSWGKKVLGRVSLHGDETILDAGCGTGLLTHDLLQALTRGRVVGVDLSRNMLTTAREHLAPAFGDRVQFLCCDLLHLPFEDAFDGIFSTAAFHWVLDHDQLFSNLYHALRPGGWLCAQCGGGPNLARLLKRVDALTRTSAYASHFRDFRFPWEYSDAETAARRMARAGFTDIPTSIEEAPTYLQSPEEYRKFVENIILHRHLERLPSAELRRQFMGEVVRQAEADTPPFFLDYWRLNLQGRRPVAGH
jgi:trans-aconitate 2-methyltransferase